MILGWGVFNLVEGVIDHYLLGIHHVVERLGLSGYDMALAGFGGVGLIVIGWWMVRGARLATRRALMNDAG